MPGIRRSWRRATTWRGSTKWSSSTSPRRSKSRRALARTIADVARRLFIPLAVGGGIRNEEDAAAVVDAGADKVSVNTAALVDPSLITRLAVRYGSQAVVVAIDAKRQGNGFAVYSRSGSLDADAAGGRVGR